MPAKKQVTREMIVSAAMELLRSGGIGAVSVKALARQLGCSTQPIYLSFSGMEQLRDALIPEAVSFFAGRLEQNGAPAGLFGMEYIRFAEAEPEVFKFLFMRPNAFAEIRTALAPITEGAIARFMEQRQLTYDQAHNLHDQLWMHAHGIASMIAAGFCTWDMDKVRRMLEEMRTLLDRQYPAQGGRARQSDI